MKILIYLFFIMVIFFMCSFVLKNCNTQSDIKKLLTNDSLKYWSSKESEWGWLFFNNNKFNYFEYDNKKERKIVSETYDIVFGYQTWHLQNDTLIVSGYFYKIKRITKDTLIVTSLDELRDCNYSGCNLKI